MKVINIPTSKPILSFASKLPKGSFDESLKPICFFIRIFGIKIGIKEGNSSRSPVALCSGCLVLLSVLALNSYVSFSGLREEFNKIEFNVQCGTGEEGRYCRGVKTALLINNVAPIISIVFDFVFLSGAYIVFFVDSLKKNGVVCGAMFYTWKKLSD